MHDTRVLRNLKIREQQTDSATTQIKPSFKINHPTKSAPPNVISACTLSRGY